MSQGTIEQQKILYSTHKEDFIYTKVNIPCQASCPVATNIPAYIRWVYEKAYGKSYQVNTMANLFPGVLGRICSRPCEDACRHGEDELGDPVNICHLKRAAADLNVSGKLKLQPLINSLQKDIAIIGAGPAGLAAAHDLALIGAQVTIFEAFDEPGGMLRYGIPEFRLPRDIIQEEIDNLLSLGITLKTGLKVGEDVQLESLLDSHDAVLLAAGCYSGNKLDVTGEDLNGVYCGLDFMIQVCKGQEPTVGKNVLVIGAGFTAFDCARSALRLGAENVTICLRRTEQDLSVTRDEIFETKSEDIKIESLMVCKRIIGRENKVEKVEFVRTKPGKMQENGKRKIETLNSSEFFLLADTVIVATGQQPKKINVASLESDQETIHTGGSIFSTFTKGLYVSGDYQTGPSTVIEAIASGRDAAETIARDLSDRPFREKMVKMQQVNTTDREFTWNFTSRNTIPTLENGPERLGSMISEVETGYDQDLAEKEAMRCYLCYLHFEIDIKKCIYCRYCVDVAPRDCIKLVKQVELGVEGAVSNLVETSSWNDVNAIVIDNSRCIRCGECLRVCPVDCISVTKVELVERIREVEK